MILTNENIRDCPDTIKILPVGNVSSEKGNFIVDKESFQFMKAEMERRGIDIVIDYEHQTLDNVQAPAGGWVKELIYTDEAIMAKVEWTPRAEEYLKNKEYKYLSPVILTRKKDNKAVVLHSIALTNTPAINGMFAIVNSTDTEDAYNKIAEGDLKMVDLKKIIELLGLSEDATEEQVMAELIKRLSKPADKGDEKIDEKPDENPDGTKEVVANSVILGLLGLDGNAKTEDVAGKIMALKTGSLNQKKEIEDIIKKMKERDAEDAVLTAMKAGKVTAAQKDWAKAYALKDSEGFAAFVDKAPVIMTMGKLGSIDSPNKKASEEVDALILKATGISKEDIEKYADKEEL